jgi:glycogen debranching enzyme
VDLVIARPGVFEYYTEHTVNDSLVYGSHGSFVVDPRLYSHKQLLPLNGICILTLIPKWLPHISRWEPFFKLFAETGYNMVHFAPLNQRGISNSPYAIFDQLSFSNDLYSEKHLEEREKDALMESTLRSIRNKYGVLSCVDVVWNHTACNSAWLEDHPEAGYNLKNSPHLRPAYELDEALMKFSNEISTVYHKKANISNEHELEDIMATWRNNCFPQLNLWQFYVVDTWSTMDGFRNIWDHRDRTSSPTATAVFQGIL